MKTEIKFNTIQDMVDYVLVNVYCANIKWNLVNRNNLEYVDEEAGKKFEEEMDAITYISSFIDPVANQAYYAKKNEIEKTRPEMVTIAHWLLEDPANYYAISLSTELAQMLDEVWKTKQPYRNASYTVRTGYVTIPGLLKRLGQTDIGKQVKQAQETAKELQAKNQRNYARKQINDHAKEIAKLVKEIAKLVAQYNLIIPASLSEMAREDFIEMYGEK